MKYTFTLTVTDGGTPSTSPARLVATGTWGAGPRGRSILTGHGAPDDATGQDGDLYFDVDSVVIYPPKAGSWPAGVPLVGPVGMQMLTTDGPPSDATGRDGDYAIDPAVMILYGPKASGAWPAENHPMVGPPGAGVPAGGKAGDLIVKTATGSTEWQQPRSPYTTMFLFGGM